MNCDIIRDLMPGYIDGILSKAGSCAVKEHLEDCGECGQIFIEMKEDMADKSTLDERAVLDGFKKIRSRTRHLKAAAALGGILLAALIIGVFLKVYVVGRMLEQSAVMTSGFQYDEQSDTLTIKGYITYAGERISRVTWKENPSTGDRIDLFVYAAETLPFEKDKKDFSITIPNMKGKVVYIVGSDYDQWKIYDWQHAHIELMRELEQEIYERVDPGWNEEKVLLSPVQGLHIVDGMEGIMYSVTFFEGDDAGYQKLGYTIIMYGEMEDADFYIWISLEEPRQIRLYEYETGTYREVP
ncbi:MAG: zf-HC2 domain-containing protein [Lachnospiraceae bacterium]|nr:zf-HC2 domain-containing protein [Lachnospiraceae bacterium]MDE7203224.1 zf-HC2 domain-containing protein [Lachnospiraceae bacterium]